MNIRAMLSKVIPDKMYLQMLYFRHFHRFIDFKDPKTFNEKLQWLKLYDRRPEYTLMVDKYAVRQYIAEKIGDQYLIPLLGAWDDPHDIDFEKLPDRFVLKWNHDSGSVVICKDRSQLDIPETVRFLASKKDHNGFYYGREWPYKNVKPKLICEQYLQDDDDGGLKDYKFFCFDGVADNVMVVAGRSEGKAKFYHFDKEYNLCRFNRLTRSLPEGFTAEKPEMMDEMFRIAEMLSQGVPHVRIDLYCVNGHIYFGEYTLYNQSGFETGFDDYSDGYLGSLIKLPEKSK